MISLLVHSLSVFRCCFDVDRSSHVSPPYVPLHHLPSKSGAHWAVSTAIWNRNKIAVAVAIGVWAINIAFFIQGRSVSPSIAEHVGSHKRYLATGAVRVGGHFWAFWTHSFNLLRSYALYGYLPWTPVVFPTPRATNPRSFLWP